MSSRPLPDLKLRVTAILSVLPGRTLTRCRILDDEAATAEEDSGMDGMVLFGPGTKELKEGMLVGAWSPWGELDSSPVVAPFHEATTLERPQKESGGADDPAAQTNQSHRPATMNANTNLPKNNDPLPVDNPGRVNLPDSHLTPVTPTARALLVTRFLIIE